jgi:DNA-binding NarL/FixJ family response regulator
VAADSAVVRAGLEAVIAQAPTLVRVGSGGSANLREQIRRLQPDVVLLEWRGEDTESIEPLFHVGPMFVLLAEAGLSASPGSGLRAVLPQDATPDEITSAIDAVASGLIVLHPDMIRSLPFGEYPRRPVAEHDVSLTPREIEVLSMLAEGLANKNIAWKLGISEHTVKFHIASLFNKLNASSRAEAVAIGMRQGIILL